MKKATLLFTLLLSTLSFSQQGFIEIEVRDSIKLKATKKASMIAELSTLKIDKITSIKEVKEIDNLSFNIMDLYINQNNKNTSGITYINSKAIVVRFSTKQ